MMTSEKRQELKMEDLDAVLKKTLRAFYSPSRRADVACTAADLVARGGLSHIDAQYAATRLVSRGLAVAVSRSGTHIYDLTDDGRACLMSIVRP